MPCQPEFTFPFATADMDARRLYRFIEDSGFSMEHRHLNHQRFTLAGIDDVIARAGLNDWAELRRAALDDPALMGKVERVCRQYAADPYAQRHHFWLHYA